MKMYESFKATFVKDEVLSLIHNGRKDLLRRQHYPVEKIVFFGMMFAKKRRSADSQVRTVQATNHTPVCHVIRINIPTT